MRGPSLRVVSFSGLALLLALGTNSAWLRTQAGGEPRIPSYVAWTPESIHEASSGDAFRGSLLVKRCDHCHGDEGFSPNAFMPNLAAIDRLSIWKQLEDFRTQKRVSPAMNPIAATLTPQDSADLAAYYSMLPVTSDPQDNRSFPQNGLAPAELTIASRLVSIGDSHRGVPPCQACHGPVGFIHGAASLAYQNADYLLNQLDAFAAGTRANDINMPMRTISRQLTEPERQALAHYYGSGRGAHPTGATIAQ